MITRSAAGFKDDKLKTWALPFFQLIQKTRRARIDGGDKIPELVVLFSLGNPNRTHNDQVTIQNFG